MEDSAGSWIRTATRSNSGSLRTGNEAPLLRHACTLTLRIALREDIAAMHLVRTAVRENKLISSVITEQDYIPAIEVTGRGWVIDVNGAIAGFAIGNEQTGNIWALFVHPDHERRGYGRRLHDVMVAWLFSRGLRRLWLTTAPNTRAERFYSEAGWHFKRGLPGGESLYELPAPISA
jgi:GNAT superfamily N-acetyltransferase